MAALGKSDIEIAARGADQFIRLYYAAYDSPDRVDSLPSFYRSASSLVWNGNPVQGDAGVKGLIEGMPSSRHEIQAFDCHPIPGTTPPSLLVTVSGTVVHGKSAETGATPTSSRSVDSQPRVFTQTFMLAPDTEPTSGDAANKPVKYYVNTDSMRFVG